MHKDVCAAVIIFGLLAAVVLFFPATSHRATAGPPALTCTVVVTGETRAALEDCG